MWAKLAAVTVMVGFLAGCGGSSSHLASNPEVRQHEAQAQKVVQGCVSHGNFLTHAGRQAIVKCIAPPGKEAAFQRCTQKIVAKAGFLTKRQRAKVYNGLATCLEQNR